MLSKLENGDDLYDHEVLEILLYFACPRVNTNPLAHRLLERFCSVSEILKADAEELKAVEGVGESVARYLKTVGLCAERSGSVEGNAVLKTFGDCKRFVSMRMRGKDDEYLELYFLEKSGRVKRIFTYTSADRNRVTARTEEILSNITSAKPFGILAAHNHLNGNIAPSENDEIFTRQICFICNMNNVKFTDHMIYSDGNIYSFNDSGKMQEISRKYSFGNALQWINNTD